MTDTPRRVFGVLCVMVAVWIVTYWLYEPSAWEPRVTFGEAPADLELEAPRPEPAPAPDPVATPRPERAAPPPQPQPTPREAPRPRVEPPTFREYTVQRGDISLEVIAQRELGDRRLWRVIAEANPFVDPAKLRIGRTVLKIPLDVTNIQGRLVDDPAPISEGEPATVPAPAPTPAPGVEYTIAAGDTLSGIAKQFYGDPVQWRVIYEANRDVLQNPDRLPRGVKIRIPPKPEGRGG